MPPLVAAAAPPPAAGYPVVLYGHGLGAGRDQLLSFAEPLTAAGYALVVLAPRMTATIVNRVTAWAGGVTAGLKTAAENMDANGWDPDASEGDWAAAFEDAYKEAPPANIEPLAEPPVMVLPARPPRKKAAAAAAGGGEGGGGGGGGGAPPPPAPQTAVQKKADDLLGKALYALPEGTVALIISAILSSSDLWPAFRAAGAAGDLAAAEAGPLAQELRAVWLRWEAELEGGRKDALLALVETHFGAHLPGLYAAHIRAAAFSGAGGRADLAVQIDLETRLFKVNKGVMVAWAALVAALGIPQKVHARDPDARGVRLGCLYNRVLGAWVKAAVGEAATLSWLNMQAAHPPPALPAAPAGGAGGGDTRTPAAARIAGALVHHVTKLVGVARAGPKEKYKVLAKQLLRTLVEMPDGPEDDLSEEEDGVLPAAEEHP
jgi:hypothetical protein